ncbi:DNA polymerase III subunit delta' [Candidatus Magnetomoraceae bacterium gMMP-15]
MSSSEDIITGQDRVIRFLESAFYKGTIPHALLFTGIEGIGKADAAKKFAMACNCLNRFSEGFEKKLHVCGTCRSCRKILSGNHPDIIMTEPSNSIIRVDLIRRIKSVLSLKPIEAEIRMIIIVSAHSMNPEAANALLKILEEPPRQTILILTATDKSDLLPTIASRCQQLRFNPIPYNFMVDVLVREHDFDQNTAMVIASLANGSFKKALSMNKPMWKKRRRWILSEMESVPDKSLVSLLAFAEKLALSKENVPDALEIMASWFRDLLICKLCPDRLINKDLSEAINHISKLISKKKLINLIDAVQTAQKDIIRTNLKLALEVMMIRLAGG